MTRDFQIILHLKEHCEAIERYLKAFESSGRPPELDSVYRDAVTLRIEQIGELANGLSDDFKNQYTDQIPWNEIRGMRNVIAHGYLTLDFGKIWSTAVRDIPLLLRFCDAVIESRKSDLRQFDERREKNDTDDPK